MTDALRNEFLLHLSLPNLPTSSNMKHYSDIHQYYDQDQHFVASKRTNPKSRCSRGQARHLHANVPAKSHSHVRALIALTLAGEAAGAAFGEGFGAGSKTGSGGALGAAARRLRGGFLAASLAAGWLLMACSKASLLMREDGSTATEAAFLFPASPLQTNHRPCQQMRYPRSAPIPSPPERLAQRPSLPA